jgi:flagellar basal-body rod protein FlgG
VNRGLYTGALSMIARSFDTEVIANNLANINTVGFKRDTTVFKDFPAMFLHRLRDETVWTPMREFDRIPPVGRVGTGVQVDDIVTDHEISPALIQTSNPFDMALEGVPGVSRSYAFFEIATTQGTMYTRAGNFQINSDGHLVTNSGAMVLGENGPIKVSPQNVRFEPDGSIIVNPQYQGEGPNMWEDRQILDRIRIVTFPDARGLEKVGYTFFKATPESGDPEKVLFGVKLRTGMLEISNVNPVREMVDLIKSQRSYEASAKVVQTHDQLLGQAVNDVGRVG